MAPDSFYGLPVPPRNQKNVFFLSHRSRIAVDLLRADGTGARFEGGALDAVEATASSMSKSASRQAWFPRTLPRVSRIRTGTAPGVVESDEAW